MIRLRSLVFQVSFYLWTGALGLATLPALILPRPVPLAVGRFWIGGTFWLLARIAGLTYTVEGAANRPDGPAVYAIKHQSAWDTLVLMRLFDDPAIVMKRELLWLPLVGWYLGRLGMIAIDRKAGAGALRGMIDAATRATAAGRDIVVFPEGTRTPPGENRPYHPGVAALYLTVATPVVPVALNSGLFWARREFSKRPGRIVVSFRPAIASGLPRAAFMSALRDAIETETERLFEAAGRKIADNETGVVSKTYGNSGDGDQSSAA